MMLRASRLLICISVFGTPRSISSEPSSVADITSNVPQLTVCSNGLLEKLPARPMT